MRTSEAVDQIIPALMKAESAFPPIVRTETVEVKGDKGTYSFSYAPLDQILHLVKPALQENGLMLMQGVEGFSLVTTLWHSSGQFIAHWQEMPHAYPSPRAFGSELTFRRRYAIAAVLGLAPEKDDDGKTAEDAAFKRAKADGTGVTPASAATGAAQRKDAYEAMQPDEKEFLRKAAANVIALLDEGREDDAYGYIQNQRIGGEERLALSHLFDSKQRSALKRAGDRAALERKAAEAK